VFSQNAIVTTQPSFDLIPEVLNAGDVSALTDRATSRRWKVMKISTDELRDAVMVLLRHLDESGQREFEISEDFYWDVSADKRYSVYEEPKELTMGQLFDDWSEVTQMTHGNRETVAYGLVWLASVMRRVGEKAV
jgi:hypothetical protein